ncbi:MAG: glycerophosphoryl diester phosphodiesterase membrane domain-containing protein [Bacteroidales bacterium]|nr:glycerophosphoryl diester phosphodiesterase membrane domain-containing protein [Bacteroidales bacterium]
METLESNNAFVSDTSTGDSYSKGWKLIFTTFLELLVVTIVYAVIQIPTNGFQLKPDNFEWFLVPVVLLAIGYAIFVAGPIGYSVNWVFLKAVRREKIEIKDMFAVFERNYWNAVIAGLVTTIIIVIGIFMLIVPGIIFACRLAFVPYLVIDQKMEALEALKASWAMTKGHGWSIFFIGVLAFFIVIGGLLVLIFGVLISAMWITAAFAVLYHSVYLKEGIPPTNGAVVQKVE